MIFSMLFLIFTFKDPNLVENLKNLADTPKKLDPAGFLRLSFSNLTIGGARATPSVKGSGGRDWRGKVEGQGLVEPW